VSNIADAIEQFVLALPGVVVAVSLISASQVRIRKRWGDGVAHFLGRGSRRPRVHFDLLGMIYTPLFFALLSGAAGGSFVGFGWGKSVPIDDDQLRYRLIATIWVCLRPLVTMIFLATGWAVLRHFFFAIYPSDALDSLCGHGARIALFMGFLHLLPLPGLAAGSVARTLLPRRWTTNWENWIAPSTYFVGILCLSNAIEPIFNQIIWFFEPITTMNF
jgi:Zn-dependent protease